MRLNVDRRRLGGSAAALAVLVGLLSGPWLFGLGSLGSIAAGAALIVMLGLAVLAGRLLWATGFGATVATLLGAIVLAFVAFVFSFFASYAIAIDHSLCGKDGSSSPTEANVAFVIAYGLIGLWGFQHPRRLLWAWPLAIVVGAALMLAMRAILPGGHGYCET